MPTTRQALLAGVLQRVGRFCLDQFEDRLRLQKTVYLLQVFGIYLGYSFNWYLYGPYSPGLTRDAFEMGPLLNRSSALHFDDETEKRFKQFMGFLGDKKDDARWLELIGSLHMLKHMYGDKSREAIFRKMAEKQPYLSDDQRAVAWQRLQQFGLV